MKKINFILILSFLFLGCSSNKELLISLEGKYKKGDLIIVNNWVLLHSEVFFNPNKNKLKFEKIDKTQRDSAISWFGQWGSNRDIYMISTLKFKPTNRDAFIDCKVLKALNPNDSVFYFIDGAPCYTYKNAINLIQNKRISEMSVIPIESALKIWGLKAGKNGALMINTKK